MAEKDHEENLKRAREIAQLGKELHETLKDKSIVDRDSLKKVERLEKLTKKIRSEAGGEDEDVMIENKPADLCGAVTQIAEASESLSKNVQDTPRQVVSASVIGKANVLLELLKWFEALFVELIMRQTIPFLLAILCVSALIVFAQDDDVVRVSTDLVVLNLTVTDREGKYVKALKKSDFKIYEDGVEVQQETDRELLASRISVCSSGAVG